MAFQFGCYLLTTTDAYPYWCTGYRQTGRGCRGQWLGIRAPLSRDFSALLARWRLFRTPEPPQPRWSLRSMALRSAGHRRSEIVPGR